MGKTNAKMRAAGVDNLKSRTGAGKSIFLSHKIAQFFDMVRRITRRLNDPLQIILEFGRQFFADQGKLGNAHHG